MWSKGEDIFRRREAAESYQNHMESVERAREMGIITASEVTLVRR